MHGQFSSIILRCGVRLFICCSLVNGLALRAQERGFSFNINGSDIGTILLKACDLDQDGKVQLAELKEIALASFKLWDTNTDGSVSQHELSTALKKCFPAPVGGHVGGAALVNGELVAVRTDQLPTPDAQLVKHILAGADSNKDASLSLQELNDFLGNRFSQWDQDGNGSLDAQELNV